MSRFYPAAFVGDFPDARAALRRLGTVDGEADACLANIRVCRKEPVLLEIFMNDPADRLPGLRLRKTAVGLMERPDGSIGLWVAMIGHLKNTREAAFLDALGDLLSSSINDPPRVDVFELPGNVVINTVN